MEDQKLYQLTQEQILNIALQGAKAYAETHPRPAHVNRMDAAKILKISYPTLKKLVVSGKIKMNRFGKIPITEIDKVLVAVNLGLPQ